MGRSRQCSRLCQSHSVAVQCHTHSRFERQLTRIYGHLSRRLAPTDQTFAIPVTEIVQSSTLWRPAKDMDVIRHKSPNVCKQVQTKTGSRAQCFYQALSPNEPIPGAETFTKKKHLFPGSDRRHRVLQTICHRLLCWPQNCEKPYSGPLSKCMKGVEWLTTSLPQFRN